MNEADALEIMSDTIWTIVTISAPTIIAATIVGVIIALLQALTQIQEMTLTFIPKILVVMAMLYFSGPYMGAKMALFSAQVYDKIAAGNH